MKDVALRVDDGQLTIRQLEWLLAVEMCNQIARGAVHRIIKDKLTMWKVSV